MPPISGAGPVCELGGVFGAAAIIIPKASTKRQLETEAYAGWSWGLPPTENAGHDLKKRAPDHDARPSR